jgi:PTS system galactitol-specific IIC component
MFTTLWISTQQIPFHTILAKNAGTKLAAGVTQVASMDQGGSPITYILTQIFHLTNLPGLLIIGIPYIACLVCTVIYSKNRKIEKDRRIEKNIEA